MTIGVTSLLYVSRSTIERSAETKSLESIIEVARSRNAKLEVTGALIFTRAYFAQILEGSDLAIDDLMASINRDIRHREVNVIERVALANRRFADWSMAYAGPSSYIERHLSPLVSEVPSVSRAVAAAQLVRLMQGFASGH